MAQPLSKQAQTIESLKQRMERDPLSRAFLQLAEEYRKAGRYEEAARVCQEGLARHPSYHTARISLGRTYLESGDLQGARRTLSEVIEMAPENHLASKLLAEVQRRLGDSSGAAETYRSILRHYPGDTEVAALLKDLEEGAAAPAEEIEPALDYRPEDIAAGPTPAPPARASGVSPEGRGVGAGRRSAPRPPTPVPRPAAVMPRPSAPPAVDDPDALQTNTLAELYLRQGLIERAVEVYREMLRVDPANERARARLLELDRGAAGPGNGQDAPAPRVVTPPVVARTVVAHPVVAARPPSSPALRRDARPATPPGVESRAATIVRLGRWLDVITRQRGGSRQEKL